MEFRLDRARGLLSDADGRVFDPAMRAWVVRPAVPDLNALSLRDAVAWLQLDPARRCRVPIGVIGPREPTDSQLATARAIGRHLGDLRLTVLNGGRQGVMEATCLGVEEAGGLSVGLLPDEDWKAANAHVSVPIASGIGVARNAIIARAALCLVAVGGGHGTISEIAFGLQFGRPVFGLDDAPAVPGLQRLDSVDEAVDAVCRVVLAL